ncbi:hypothetical protein Rsub_02278 [Raphidocelis subcapitata]|uniref:Uncharacterized protein n=1 Tax=Raphidocelis subcapitata TaxID=307507 RepID=A0A2V0NVG3_9CHLO|nr:hypothetical protein Rsub_02278 [Raphidocelis subcapitata]|eukprot:GBF89560.1 hypothetical protein Rsub_02278 [Raphidocelis subcapitata]
MRSLPQHCPLRAATAAAPPPPPLLPPPQCRRRRPAPRAAAVVAANSGGNGGSSATDGSQQRGERRLRAAPPPRQQPAAAAQQPQPARPVERRVLSVSSGSDLGRTAGALIQQLDAFGSAEIWCTGVTSQVYAVGVLVTAQEMLASRGSGLAATFQYTSPDGTPDSEKRTMRKLVVGAVAAPAPDPAEWSAPGLRTSTAAVRDTASLAAALRAGVESAAGGHALEGRGEQGVNRALRAVLALQAELGEPLSVWPWYGAVADAAAAARGEEGRAVAGTVLLVRRCSAE